MVDEKIKAEIDAMDYEDLLRNWRFATVGDPKFQGENGEYFRKRMAEKRMMVGDSEHIRISKALG